MILNNILILTKYTFIMLGNLFLFFCLETFKGSVCNIYGALFTEYTIHNYVFFVCV